MFLVKWVSSGSWKFYIFCSVLKSSKVWKFLEKSFLCLCIIHCIVLLMAAGKSSDQVITTSVQSIMGSSSTPSGLALTHSIYPSPQSPIPGTTRYICTFSYFLECYLKQLSSWSDAINWWHNGFCVTCVLSIQL